MVLRDKVVYTWFICMFNLLPGRLGVYICHVILGSPEKIPQTDKLESVFLLFDEFSLNEESSKKRI